MALYKLNMVMTYPVQWGEYEVMSNFVQNFYDALGKSQFKDRFDASFADGTIVMKSDAGFSKDWLLYIGASSKRNGTGTYAGRFGEGFKIASLVSIRDMGMGVCMESQNWKLTVMQADDTIDGVPVKVLAYDIVERPYEENTILTLTGATQQHFDRLFYDINRFYYEGNAYFGQCIAKGQEYAVYTALPSPNGKKPRGGLFLNLELRNRFSIPVFFCLHSFPVSGDDRDRFSLPEKTVISAIREVIRYLTAAEALEVLESFQSIWFDCISRKGLYQYDWYWVISDLIRSTGSESSVLAEFQKRYSSLLVAESYWHMYSPHKKAMAHEWFRNSEYSGKRRVCSLFCRLGIVDLYHLCLKNGGFEEETFPNEIQKRRIDILQHLARCFFGDLICYDVLPQCRLILNEKSPLAGKAACFREEGKIYNSMGLRVVSEIRSVFLLRRFLEGERLKSALPVYMHELLHQYGGDSSIQFRKALIRMNEILMEHRKEIQEFESKWKAC